MGNAENTIRWDKVQRTLERKEKGAIWKPYGIPEMMNPITSAFAEVDVSPKWDVPDKIAISVAVTGAYVSQRVNPNQLITVEEIRNSARECLLEGATTIHVHVRDENGFNVLDPQRLRDVILPLKEEFPEALFDGCLVAVNEKEWAAMGEVLDEHLFEYTPVNCLAAYNGDSLFIKPPHVMIEKTRLIQEKNTKVMLAISNDGDVDNARRYLIASGLLEKPYYWGFLPALPGCSPMHNSRQMIEGLCRVVNAIRDIDPDSRIIIPCAGRSASYLATLSMLMGLNIRVGMEDSIWRWPHKDDLITSNVEELRRAKAIAAQLGREMMTPNEYRDLLGLARR